jgi:DNA-binding NarL/FixJ family response regulator
MRVTTEVYLLAENRLLREALIRLLSKKRDVRIVGASAYSQGIHDEIIAARPRIILLDSNGLTFSGATLISTLSSALRDLRVVMVDMDADETTFLTAIRAGVVGYVLKDASALEVAAMIRAVASGQAVCPPSLSLTLFRFVAQIPLASSASSWRREYGLSQREQQMVDLLRERLTNKEIAARLNLSEQTVKNHVHHVLRKVGVQDRTGVLEMCSPD